MNKQNQNSSAEKKTIDSRNKKTTQNQAPSKQKSSPPKRRSSQSQNQTDTQCIAQQNRQTGIIKQRKQIQGKASKQIGEGSNMIDLSKIG